MGRRPFVTSVCVPMPLGRDSLGVGLVCLDRDPCYPCLLTNRVCLAKEVGSAPTRPPSYSLPLSRLFVGSGQCGVQRDPPRFGPEPRKDTPKHRAHVSLPLVGIILYKSSHGPGPALCPGGEPPLDVSLSVVTSSSRDRKLYRYREGTAPGVACGQATPWPSLLGLLRAARGAHEVHDVRDEVFGY